MKTAYSAGLQSLALALIFMPEPITTVVGVGLLNYVRVARKQRPTVTRRVINTFEDHYTYRMNLINNTTINVQLSPRRHGQMPKVYPSIARLQDNPQVLKVLREGAQRQARASSTPFSKLELAGLMKPPRPRSQTRYFTPKR
jgi:hypothetical protein